MSSPPLKGAIRPQALAIEASLFSGHSGLNWRPYVESLGMTVGDVSWAFQWDFTIAAGSSAQIGKDKRLIVAVPEPTVAVFGGLGLMVLIATRRQRS